MIFSLFWEPLALFIITIKQLMKSKKFYFEFERDNKVRFEAGLGLNRDPPVALISRLI